MRGTFSKLHLCPLVSAPVPNRCGGREQQVLEGCLEEFIRRPVTLHGRATPARQPPSVAAASLATDSWAICLHCHITVIHRHIWPNTHTHSNKHTLMIVPVYWASRHLLLLRVFVFMIFSNGNRPLTNCQVAEEGTVAPSSVSIVSSMSNLFTLLYDWVYKREKRHL